MNLISIVVKLVLSALVFLMGYKIGQHDANVDRKPPVHCPAREGFAQTVAHLQGGLHVAHVSVSRDANDLLFHKNRDVPVNSRVFSSLYHTNSQVKAEIIVTDLDEWENKRTGDVKCSQIYRTNTGSRTNQPAKCVAIVSVPVGYNSPMPLLHRMGATAGRLDQFINDYTRRKNRQEGDEMLPPFLRNIEDLKSSFLSIVGSPHDRLNDFSERKTLVVMVANTGVFNLLLNFMCSCRTSGIDTKSIVVFVGEKHHVDIINSMGATPVYLPAIGEMPTKVAGNYGDKVFGKMMWLKVTSVFIANYAGFNVLFQDTDLVWFKNPIPFFDSHPVDATFMDDGARSPRFAPYFSNSGFYYLKYNARTRYLMHRMMLSVFEISYTHSHQGTLTKYMIESHDLAGLQITALNQLEFPSGKMFHHNKTYMRLLQAGQVDPYVFHMCWTANSKDKIKNFLAIKKWYVTDEPRCTQPGSVAAIPDLLTTCCAAIQ